MKKDIWNSVAQYLIKRWVTFAVWLGERIPPPRVFDCFENIWPKKWILLFELRAHSTNISACITVYDCQDYIGILSQMGLKYFLLLLFFPTSFIFLLLIMCSRSSSGGGGGGGTSNISVFKCNWIDVMQKCMNSIKTKNFQTNRWIDLSTSLRLFFVGTSKTHQRFVWAVSFFWLVLETCEDTCSLISFPVR